MSRNDPRECSACRASCQSCPMVEAVDAFLVSLEERVSALKGEHDALFQADPESPRLEDLWAMYQGADARLEAAQEVAAIVGRYVGEPEILF